MLARIAADGRLGLADGDDREILPGLRVYTGGRHTFASQYVGARTRAGTVILASDNAYLFENLERGVAIAATIDAPRTSPRRPACCAGRHPSSSSLVTIQPSSRGIGREARGRRDQAVGSPRRARGSGLGA